MLWSCSNPSAVYSEQKLPLRGLFSTEMVKYKIRIARFLVFWDVMLALQVVPDILEDHVAFVCWVRSMQEVCTVRVSGTACPTKQCSI
jgi:hypothetical protein